MSHGDQSHYPLSLETWSEVSPECLKVLDESGAMLLVMPLAFLKDGKVSQFGYVLDCIRRNFEEPGSLLFQNVVVGEDDPVREGQAIFLREDGRKDPCTPLRGPRFKFKYRAAVEGAETSTMSNSKRSTANQSHFRLALVARDFSCLLSDADYEKCTACHILPQSRPEYYEEVLGNQARYLFSPAYGLLLRDDLHHSFDRGEIALLPHQGQYIVHIFKYDKDTASYHGKILDMNRFRGSAKTRPNNDLLLFHYQQCSMKYLRGFSFGM